MGWGCLAEQEVRDRRFKVQSTFSSLAHSVVPPLLLATQLSDRPVGPGFGITATTSSSPLNCMGYQASKPGRRVHELTSRAQLPPQVLPGSQHLVRRDDSLPSTPHQSQHQPGTPAVNSFLSCPRWMKQFPRHASE